MPGLVTKNLLTVALFALSLQTAQAQTTPASPIDDLPVSAIFVASSGLWEEEAVQPTTQPPVAQPGAANTEEPPPTLAPPQRGYYKVVAMRQVDGTARIYLQQIAYTPDGPHLMQTVELEEFSKFKTYVTDIRPESSSGNGNVPGLFVTVHLKTDPMATETEGWTILIDELGDMKIERASN